MSIIFEDVRVGRYDVKLHKNLKNNLQYTANIVLNGV